MKIPKNAKEISNSADLILVDKALAGDPRAFDALILRYKSALTGLVSGYAKRVGAVEDLLQEVIVKAYLNLAKFDGTISFNTWLISIARNTARLSIFWSAAEAAPDTAVSDFTQVVNPSIDPASLFYLMKRKSSYLACAGMR